LRLEDNTALFHALNENEQILPIFIFDETILQHLEKMMLELLLFTISLKN